MIYEYRDMAARLTDLKRLARRPMKGERGGEQSSTDRRSRYDAATDRYLDWGANADANGIIRVQEDGGSVIADLKGPGCLWRIWFAAPGSEGRLAIFIDGAEEPVVDCPAMELFTGGTPPFHLEQLCYEETGGFNCYIPIPYNKSCKVVGYGAFGAFYQFSYTELEEGAQVESFQMPLQQSGMEALEMANALLARPLVEQSMGDDVQEYRAQAIIRAQARETLWSCQESGAIRSVRLRPDKTGWASLKRLILQLYWDGDEQPAVWAPFCDFFGGACGMTPYESLPMGIGEDGWFHCRWYMPYAAGAQLVLSNLGQEPVTVECVVCAETNPEAAPDLLRFHAKWNRNRHQPTRPDRAPDHTFLKADGTGRYLGCTMHIYKPADNRDMQAVPGEYWWGEGDEKFFIDGEMSPSFFGTGTEDYFGFAWAWPDLFGRPYHAQNFNQGGIHNRGNRSFVRVHIADDVPYHTSIEACMETYYREKFASCAFTPYWYAEAGTADLYDPDAAIHELLTDSYVENPEQHPAYESPPLLFANADFAQGTTEGWTLQAGTGFAEAAVVALSDGSFFSYCTDSDDRRRSELCSPEFLIEGGVLEFSMGGTWRRDPEGSFAALVRVRDGAILASSCCHGEPRRRYLWDVSDFIGERCAFKLVDEGTGGERSLLFTGLRVSGRL